MRTIKFRGFTNNLEVNGWIYGYLVKYDGKEKYTIMDIFTNNSTWRCDVVTESIGQFTGLLDKNGKEIYEGDIVSYIGGLSPVSIEDGLTLVWCELENRLSLKHLRDIAKECEVIGNIYENQELLNG